MSDILIRKVGRTGRITLNRPQSLNAVSLSMIHAIEAILPDWAQDDDITMVVIDAAGDKAFSAGGDIADIYGALTKGVFDKARHFWREEYPVNAALFHFPKPVASFLQGFTMGGGVGVGCHASHRVVGDSSRIAMPECGIGLVPDVGGSLLLARAPGRIGEYMGTTSYRMDARDAIFAGFADYYIAEANWPALITELEQTGDWTKIDAAALPIPSGKLEEAQPQIDAFFAGETLRDILTLLARSDDVWASATLQRLATQAPLATASTIELIHRVRTTDRIETALTNEYRYVHRAAEQGDFREGIRAAIIDKDKAPKWQHGALDAVTPSNVSTMLMPLGDDELKLETTP
ncbi:enoyl-CoA hydratase/isomerase family protein [Rhodobacteraceae bacterium]|nr:enoyl-CoA hydratase/isomerase family protein [Paracoccaceae bacterium]